MNCACMSVGKAGKGAVERESGLSGPLALTLIQSGLSSTVTPASRRPASIACISEALAPTSSSEPPVMAAAQASPHGSAACRERGCHDVESLVGAVDLKN